MSEGTRSWIILLVSVIIGATGTSYGVIKGQVGHDIERIDSLELIDVRQDKETAKMRTDFAVIENELKHINVKLEDFGEDIKGIRTIMEKQYHHNSKEVDGEADCVENEQYYELLDI